MGDFYGYFSLAVTSVQHLLQWLTPARRELLNGLGFDRQAGRPPATFSRFLNGDKQVKLTRAGVSQYYPSLRLLGYIPPTDTSERSNVQQ